MKRKRRCVPVNCNALGNRDHEWLRFDDFEVEYAKRLESLWPRRHMILAGRRLDLAALDSVGQRARWSRMMTNPWCRLFRVHEIQYLELVMEFFSTFEFDYPSV
ncbi:hypothetical protein M8C21_025864 [Ambrosia artemisiifolia]|uniref:Uncharacterized protein n=1 Tax=Ambrosia artemisiifolia TaxID=4212 RepID=A0AAD5G551_AMBAR|nr:hypothetical protein M8C21_025864 [Ambrosia artemisiifolia]